MGNALKGCIHVPSYSISPSIEALNQCNHSSTLSSFMWYTEVILPVHIKRTRFHCPMNKATHILVPTRSKCLSKHFTVDQMDRLFTKAVEDILTTASQSRAFLASNLAFIFPSGRGPTLFPSWRAVIPNAHFLTPEPHYSDAHRKDAPYYDPQKDVLIPGYMSYGRMRELLSMSIPVQRRSLLVSFIGQNHGYVRPRLFDELNRHQRKDVIAERKVRNYARVRGNSKFCIVARGLSSWTLQFFETLWSECIPLLVNDHYAPPFEDIIDYSFVVRQHELNLSSLMDTVDAMSDAHIYSLVKLMRAQRCNLSFLHHTCNASINIAEHLARKHHLKSS